MKDNQGASAKADRAGGPTDLSRCASQPKALIPCADSLAEARIRLAEQYKGLDLVNILLEHKELALSGGYPGVGSPHYALAGMFEWAAGEIERLRRDSYRAETGMNDASNI